MFTQRFAGACALALLCNYSTNAYAHATVGDRVFPATLAVEDPGVADELTLPQVSRFKEDGEWGTETSSEYSKRLTENFGVSVEGAWVNEGGTSGMDNIGVGAKYVFLKNAEHELMLSAGLDWDIGGSGSHRIGENFSTYTPALFFGKGMGDLPDSMNMFKPLAITGTAGYAIATHSDERAAQFGFTVQYSIPYLEQHIKDFDIPKPFNTMIPVVEFAFETPTDGEHPGRTTGTINPGIIFMGQTVQIGLEAQLPLNHDSGQGVGYLAQVHFYLDELFPQTLGKPIW